MSAVSLLTPILSGGIQNVNFVNGRVLTAADMTAERTANLQRQRLLGTCVGDGVASGFEVTLSSSSVSFGTQVVHVTAGVAFNRKGDTLQLPSDTDVTLAAPPQAAPANSGLFAPCQPPQTQLTNPGIYVLTVMPASGYQGQAPVTQLTSGGVGTSCSSQYATAGVQFRLVSITLASTGTGLQPTLYTLANQIQTQLNNNASAASVAPALSKFQNGLAHVCFGTETLASYSANPFPPAGQASPFESYGVIDSLRSGKLVTDCEVPLAIMYWAPSGIQFIDLWSVRRSVFPLPAAEDWPLFSGRRRYAEGLAIFLQFQNQIAGLAFSLGTTILSVAATDYFYYLPAAAFLPVGNVNAQTGFDYLQFFSKRTYRNPVFIEGARLDQLLHTSFGYPPIDLSDKELLWVYQVRENQETINEGASSPPPLYMLFHNGQMGFRGEARYDLNYWNYANYV